VYVRDVIWRDVEVIKGQGTYVLVQPSGLNYYLLTLCFWVS